jgi:hypothetical protein
MMRVFILLLALVTTPFVAGVSQGQSGSAGRPSDPKTVHCDRRSATATARLNVVGKDNCPELTPPPPPPPVPAGAVIDGTVYNDINGRPGLSGWVVELSGVDTLGATVSASTHTDASGHYVFVGLAPGMYTVCAVPQSGWSQTFPPMGASCATGLGYEFPIEAGTSAGFNNFGYVTR